MSIGLEWPQKLALSCVCVLKWREKGLTERVKDLNVDEHREEGRERLVEERK